MTKNSRADNLQQHQKEFEELTGITVLSEQMPWSSSSAPKW